jgi:hypothetical protein
MTTLESTHAETATQEQDPVLRAVQTITGASAAVAPLFLWVSIGSLAAAILVWGAWVAPFLSVSLVSVIAGIASLALLVVPGLFLVKVYRALRDLPHVLDRVAEFKRVLPADVLGRARAQAQEAAGKGFFSKPIALSCAYGRTILELRTTVLGAEEVLTKVPGTGSLLSFLASPATFLLSGFHGGIGVAVRVRCRRAHPVPRGHGRLGGPNQAISSWTTLPCTSVSRKSRPA